MSDITIEKLKEQYNKLLIGIFNDNSDGCIKGALDDCDCFPGERIHSIIETALSNLRSLIYEELGLEAETVGLGSGFGLGIGCGAGAAVVGVEMGPNEEEDDELDLDLDVDLESGD